MSTPLDSAVGRCAPGFWVLTPDVAEPSHTSRELLERLQAQCPGGYPDGQLRTLQRRLKEWRREAAHRMVFGTMSPMLVWSLGTARAG